MNIDFAGIKPLTNAETYLFLKDHFESKHKVRAQQTLFYTAKQFFNEKTVAPCQTSEQLQNFLAAIKGFKLSKNETLLLINHCPATQVELSVVRSSLGHKYQSPKSTIYGTVLRLRLVLFS